MQALRPFMLKHAMPKLIFALVAMAMGIFISRGDTNATFSADTTVTVPTLTANANPNITTVFCILGPTDPPADNCPGTVTPGDINFSSVINGSPAASFVAPGPGSPAYDATLYPGLGDVVGTLSSTSTLGLTGLPCTSPVTPTFTFLNATTDNSQGNQILPVPQAATNPGSGGTLDNIWSDNGASTTGTGADAPWNGAWTSARATAEGLPASAGLTAAEQTNGLPAQVDRYPSYLNTIFDPDGVAGVDPFVGAQPVQPLTRYAGAVNVVGTSVVLDLVVFAPGVLANAGFGANHPFTLTSTIGYTSIAVLQDPTVAASHGSISDFCSPVASTATIRGIAAVNDCNGNGGSLSCDTPGEISNPTAGANTLPRYSHPRYNGSQTWTSNHESLRDFDSDGAENSLDACALNADTYNARTGTPLTEDDDQDGMPDVCDPNDLDGNTDHDGDGWENSYDNCPLNSNPTQADNELTVAYGTTAPSGGPRGDSIGDPCDADDTVSNGPFGTTTSTDSFTITGGTTAVDSDGDGVDDTAEANVGTDPARRCGPGSEVGGPGPFPGAADDGTSTAWGLDFKSAGIFGSTDRIKIDDLNSFLSPRKLDLDPPPGDANLRWDLSPGAGIFATIINIGDLNAMLGGAPANPKMFNNNRALDGPACTGR
jgi:hypothetical protein